MRRSYRGHKAGLGIITCQGSFGWAMLRQHRSTSHNFDASCTPAMVNFTAISDVCADMSRTHSKLRNMAAALWQRGRCTRWSPPAS
jgi:hypothetical protein